MLMNGTYLKRLVENQLVGYHASKVSPLAKIELPIEERSCGGCSEPVFFSMSWCIFQNIPSSLQTGSRDFRYAHPLLALRDFLAPRASQVHCLLYCQGHSCFPGSFQGLFIHARPNTLIECLSQWAVSYPG